MAEIINLSENFFIFKLKHNLNNFIETKSNNK